MLSSISTNEFMASTTTHRRSELVRGQVRALPPASRTHARVSGNVARLLAAYAEHGQTGRAFDEHTQFELPNLPDTVRMPTVSFVRTDRLPLGGSGGGWLSLSPDLAVEVLSPEVSAADLEDKLADYRAAGTPLVWVINPSRRRVSVITPTAPVRWVDESETLDGADVLPGFSCPVASVFDGVAPD